MTRSATVQDLYRVEGRAELIDGAIVHMPPAGDLPNEVAGEIFASLREHAKRTGTGRAVTDGAGFVVNLPRRRSFSPDASFWTGPRAQMRFFEGAPRFAVEVRSEGDYGTRAEQAMASKRAEYFAAGTLVVWDVDLLDAERTVRSYTAASPDFPEIFGRGAVANAGVAVPGWSMPIDDLLPGD